MPVDVKRTGTVALTFAIMKACDVIRAYHNKIVEVIDAAVANNTITSTQGEQAKLFLTTVDGLCGIFRLITGY